MTGPSFAQRLARVLSREVPELASPPKDRDATVAAMQRALRARRQRRARRWWLGSAAAAAAFALVASALLHRRAGAPAAHVAVVASQPEVVAAFVSGGVLALSNGHTSPLLNGTPIQTGDRVLALLDGHATIALATGTRLSVEGGGDVALLSSGVIQIFALGAGSVRADVAKLHQGERFVIRTEDAEVEVRGTSFRVATAPPSPTCGGGTTTRVTVFEGVVTVRSGSTEAAVHPGESWPPDCGVTPVRPETSSSVPPHVTAVSSTAATQATPPPSDLALENDLFDKAMLAKRDGDVRAAVDHFDRLLSRHPDCPFAESAAAERLKLLAGYDRARAASAAREYLHRYPNGFARSDAEALRP